MMLFITLFLAAFGGPLVVTQADLEHTVELYVRARYANAAREMTVEFRSVPDGLAVSGSAYTLRVSALATPLPLGNVSFPVEVISDGHVVNQCIVSVKVRTYDSVLVTARQLGQHEQITSEDVRREKIETTGLRGTALTKCAQLAGLRTKRIINAGSVLTEDLVQAVPEIVRGTSVTLIVKGKNFRFSVDAVAREDGVHGEQVRVQRVGNSAHLLATVLDARTVEMTIQ